MNQVLTEPKNHPLFYINRLIVLSRNLAICLIIAISTTAILSQDLLAQNKQITVIAKIDNQIITNVDLEKRYQFFVKTSNIAIKLKEEEKFLKNQLLEKLIEESLQILNAKKLNIILTDLELEKALDEIALLQGLSSNKNLKQKFQKEAINYDEYARQIRAQLLWKKTINKTVAPRIKITQLEIDEAIEVTRINKYKTSFNLAEIFIPFTNNKEQSEALSLMQKLYKEIKNGADFKNIAQQFSQSSSHEFNGEIGWVEESSLNNIILENIKNIKVNDLTKPIKVSNGYYIFKLLGKRSIDSLEENEITEIRQLIFQKKLENAAKSYLNNLKMQSYIKKLNAD